MQSMSPILVVDDDADQRAYIRELITQHFPGRPILCAESGAAALDRARAHQPDLVLLDARMPAMDGFETSRRLKEDAATAHIPILMFSGMLTEVEYRIKAVDCGADGFLCKPFLALELVAQVRALLRIKEYEDDLRREHGSLGQELHETEDRYHRLFESASDAILMLADMRIIDCNRKALELFRARRDELIGKSPLDLSPPRQRDGRGTKTAVQLIEEGLQRGEPQRFTWTLQRMDGSPLEADISLDRVLFAQKEHDLAIIRDISERTEWEDALRESEARYRGLYEFMLEGVCRHEVVRDDDGRIVNYRVLSANPAYEQLTGLDATQAAGVHASALYGTGIPPFLDIFAQVVETGEGQVFDAWFEPMQKHFRISVFRNAPDQFTTVFSDISRRKRVEEELRESEARYRQLFESASDAIFLMKDGLICDVNPKALEMFKTRKEDVIGVPHKAFLPPRQRDGTPSEKEAVRRIERAMTGVSDQFDFLFQRPDGTTLDAEVSLTLMRLGTEAYVLGIVRDISERKNFEAELRSERDAAQRYLDLAGSMIVVLDRNGAVTLINRKGCSILGRTEEEIVGRNWRQSFVPPAWRERVGAVFATHLGSEPADAGTNENPVLNRNGDERVIAWQNATLRGEDGTVLGIISSGQDITERRRAEERTRIQTSALEAAANAIVITDVEGNILSVNPAFTATTGYTQDEVVGRNPRVLKSGQQDPAFYEHLWRTIMAGDTWHGEIVNKRKDGTVYTEEMIVTPIRASGEDITHFIAIKQDISERKENEQRYEQMRSEFMQAQKMEALGRLAGGIAHDFNNLLTSITGFSELALENLPLHEPCRADMEAVVQAADSATKLTRQLLAFSRKQVAHLEHFDLNDVITGIENLLRRTLGEDIEVKTFLTEDGGRVRADKGQMEQVIMNLCVNSRDAMPTGGRIEIATAVVDGVDLVARPDAQDHPGRFVELTIRDNGSGMTAEVQQHAFDPFYTTKGVAGTGLGLSTVYGIVKQSNGRIAIKTGEGEGTTFKLYFPAVAQAPAPVDTAGEAEIPGGTETLLLVEDENDVRRVAVRMLRSLGYEVKAADSAKRAMAILSEHGERIAAVISDIVMPDKSGPQLIKEMRTHRPDLKAMLITGHPLDMAEGHNNGPHALPILLKPFTRRSLGERLREVLDA